MNGTYTLALTKGVHVISAADALKIFAAFDGGKRIVTIQLDPFSGYDSNRVTTIAVAHVVFLTPNPQSIRDELESIAGRFSDEDRLRRAE